MPDFITPNKGLTEPTVGSDNNTWGGLLNTDLSLIDTVLGGTVSISLSGTTASITGTQAQSTGYEFTGSLSGTNTITWPAFYGMAVIQNTTTGGHSISCGISGGTFVTVLNGETVAIWSDGTNFYRLAQVGGGTGTTGTGAVVLATSPTLTTPALGTPTSGVATNLTGTASGLTAGAATAANSLNSATTTVVVNTATAPTTGQVLTATSSTAANWQSPGGAAIAGYINGLGLSNDSGTPNTKCDVAVGTAADSTNAVMMTLASPGVVNFGTTGANGLDTGSQASSTWYAILLINGTSGTAVMATKETAGSAISPTMPSGYTYYRYIGSVWSNASNHIEPFAQAGQYFYWGTVKRDLNGTGVSVATLFTLSVPLSVSVVPIFSVNDSKSFYNTEFDVFWSPLSSSTPPSFYNYLGTDVSSGGFGAAVQFSCFMTNTSGQLYYYTQYPGSQVNVYTAGWIDPHVAAVF